MTDRYICGVCTKEICPSCALKDARINELGENDKWLRKELHDATESLVIKQARIDKLEKVAQAVKQLSDYPREGIEDYLLRRFVQECVDQLAALKEG